MRIWSIHPSYLDAKGLVAVWREGLLAYHVLAGNTKGYKNHPQLIRFRAAQQPLEAIICYLHAVADEADRRGYTFDRTKLPPLKKVPKIPLPRKQLEFETNHLKNKLKVRDAAVYAKVTDKELCECHPLFTIVEGEIEPWEKV